MINANAQLAGFNGTVNWYRHSLPGYTYTDGVQHLAATYKAYWIIDLALSYQFNKQNR